jgi:uroporphyrinogen-III decarboxylase
MLREKVANMNISTSSRQRMLSALKCEEPDHTPCSFMLFKGLKLINESYLEFLQNELRLGLDVYVELPPRMPSVVNDYYNLHGIPVSYDPSVKIKEWLEKIPGEEDPLMVKEYLTPEGTLRTEVWQTDDWPWADHVPFLDDYLVPRSRKFLVETIDDLNALQYLLIEPTAVEIDNFHQESREAIEFARAHDLLLVGGWGVGADLIGWIYGLQNMVFGVYDHPQLIKQMLEMIGNWNRKRMQVLLNSGIDLYIKRAWYENCDFWTPSAFKEFILPELAKDVELAHANGVYFGYLITSSVMPLLDIIADSGVDALIGVDPEEWDLERTKQKLGGKVCLWGGVNGHRTVEMGSPEKVRQEVQYAMEVLSPGGGFILSPVDNVREYSPLIEKNVKALIDEWQSFHPSAVGKQ